MTDPPENSLSLSSSELMWQAGKLGYGTVLPDGST
jgi:hypothetical protein